MHSVHARKPKGFSRKVRVPVWDGDAQTWVVEGGARLGVTGARQRAVDPDAKDGTIPEEWQGGRNGSYLPAELPPPGERVKFEEVDPSPSGEGSDGGIARRQLIYAPSPSRGRFWGVRLYRLRLTGRNGAPYFTLAFLPREEKKKNRVPCATGRERLELGEPLPGSWTADKGRKADYHRVKAPKHNGGKQVAAMKFSADDAPELAPRKKKGASPWRRLTDQRGRPLSWTSVEEVVKEMSAHVSLEKAWRLLKEMLACEPV